MNDRLDIVLFVVIVNNLAMSTVGLVRKRRLAVSITFEPGLKYSGESFLIKFCFIEFFSYNEI